MRACLTQNEALLNSIRSHIESAAIRDDGWHREHAYWLLVVETSAITDSPKALEMEDAARLASFHTILVESALSELQGG